MKRLIWTLFLVGASPWLWLLLKYPASFRIDKNDFLSYRDQYFVDKINTYQGLSGNRLTINKYTWLIKEFSDRAAECADPGLLFFTGDLDNRRSIRTYGAVLLSLLPAAGIGLAVSGRKSKLGVAGSILGSAILSGLMPQHYFIPTKIPIFVGYAWLSAAGLIYIKENWKASYQAVYGGLIGYDMLLFAHELALHYTANAPL